MVKTLHLANGKIKTIPDSFLIGIVVFSFKRDVMFNFHQKQVLFDMFPQGRVYIRVACTRHWGCRYVSPY